MIYKNPVLQFDFSDPDVIRVGKDFYMIASSFNHLPGLPILHSKDLVNWHIINYAVKRLPDKFNQVKHGEGIWAPSIRYHNKKFYIFIPMPDEGIFVCESDDIKKEFSPLRPLLVGKGYEDPCPIWENGKCYVVFGFVKSRIGFNSTLAIFETDEEVKERLTEYKVVYEGHNDNPTIEGPKFYKRNGYYYIMAPAGSVKGGWQTALRSKSIYGPYESKIVMFQGDSLINGPHQGALVDLDNKNEKYAFIHFQDMRAYGRIVHLEPAKFINDWPICGNANDPLLCGTPVYEHEYLVDKKSNYKMMISDDFNSKSLSDMWQYPANDSNFLEFKDFLQFNIKHTDIKNEINLIPYAIYSKVPALEFNVSTNFDISNLKNGNHFGFTVMGQKYIALDFKNEDDKYYMSIISGEFKKNDEVLKSILINDTSINIKAKFKNENIYDLYYDLYLNNKLIVKNIKAYAGRWIGAKIGYYGYSNSNELGFVNVYNYKTKIVNKNKEKMLEIKL